MILVRIQTDTFAPLKGVLNRTPVERGLNRVGCVALLLGVLVYALVAARLSSWSRTEYLARNILLSAN